MIKLLSSTTGSSNNSGEQDDSHFREKAIKESVIGIFSIDQYCNYMKQLVQLPPFRRAVPNALFLSP